METVYVAFCDLFGTGEMDCVYIATPFGGATAALDRIQTIIGSNTEWKKLGFRLWAYVGNDNKHYARIEAFPVDKF